MATWLVILLVVLVVFALIAAIFMCYLLGNSPDKEEDEEDKKERSDREGPILVRNVCHKEPPPGDFVMAMPGSSLEKNNHVQ